MNTLPEDVQRYIVSFLPYNDRVEANRYLPAEYKSINKLKSDEHNLYVKTELLKHKMQRFNQTEGTSIERVLIAKNMFTYLLNTKDECLFANTTSKFHSALRTSVIGILNHDGYSRYIVEHHWKHVRSIRNVCERLISKIDSKTPADEWLKREAVSVV